MHRPNTPRLFCGPERVAGAGATTRIVSPDGFGAGKLRRPPRPDPNKVIRLRVIWRAEKAAPYVPQRAIRNARARTGELREGIFRCSTKGGAIGNAERAAKTADRLFDVIRCCHWTALRESVRPSR